MPVPIQQDTYPRLTPVDLSHFWDSREDRYLAWSALDPWFKTHGYTLYPQTSPAALRPEPSAVYDLSNDAVEYPYAFAHEKTPFGRAFYPALAVFPAVNKHHRDVVIKIVSSDSPELVIFKHLVSEPQRSDPLNLTVPVLDILKYDDNHSFVVMPRWSTASSLRDNGFDTLRTVFEFTKSLLKVLSFLHKNLIAYRDFKLTNILINCYHQTEGFYDFRPFFSSRQAKFVLCDFDLSIMFPPDTPPAARVCPASESDWGSPWYHPPDTANGEALYDPFAYDVACLGGLLCGIIGYLTPLAPPLAPFLDRMITPDIPSRYTAAEALEAFTVLSGSYSSEHLDQPIPQPPYRFTNVSWQTQDRWAGLPKAFVEKHTRVRPPVRPKRKITFYNGSSCWLDWDVPSDDEGSDDDNEQ